ncbi:MAG: NFACT RNA binding domain-containing protein [Myxococcota bacterium]
MSLRPEELLLIAAEVTRELAGGVVQKVAAPTTTRVYLELRVPGRSVTLLLCTDPGVVRLSAVDERPQNPPTPPTWQSVLRAELTGAKLADAEMVLARRTLLLHFTKAGRYVNLVLEATNEPAIVLCTQRAGAVGADLVRAVSIPSRPGLRIGQPWTPLDEVPLKASTSRLAGDHVVLRLCHAAEALLAAAEQKTWVDSRRAPLLAKLKKLERTKDKVRAEAERTERAQTFRREGELLTQNLWRLKRGERAVTLPEYLEDGSTREVTVLLDPKRTPQQEVEYRFHQYKRMLRGTELARQRLATLEAETKALQDELARLSEAPPAPPPVSERREKPAQQEALPPYREYVGHGGQRIWVGRGSTHNDALTFHVARPFHVWFHARGVPGAHVVVPLEKNTALSGEVMLDAAHLAAHHSDARGEPRVEVSYTPVKFVHKPKDAAPGAVTFSREKTLLLRLEPARLQRLLDSIREP